MRILYVSQYFPPEIGAPSARVSEFARCWKDAGHDVTVLTAFAHHPTGIKAKADRGVLSRREDHEGIDVVRTYVYATANKGTLKRMLSYASFMLSALLIGFWRVRRPDVVIATSPQLLTAVAGYVIARLKRVPFVFEVRDLWPESIIAVDAMKENLLIRLLKRTARYLYEHADQVVTVGEGYRRAIHERYGLPLERMIVIPNGIDTALFIPAERENDVRGEYDWGNRFVAMYLGTHGMAHALGRVLDVAARFRDDPELLFVFVGEGAEKEALKERAAALKLPNVQFIDQQPKQRVPAFYAACDVGLVTLRNTPLFQEVLPSKIFEYLGMERPVVISVAGEAQRLVETAGGGVFVPPEDVDAMTDALRMLRADRSRLATMGRDGRAHILANYDRRALAQRYADLLRNVCAGRGHSASPT